MEPHGVLSIGGHPGAARLPANGSLIKCRFSLDNSSVSLALVGRSSCPHCLFRCHSANVQNVFPPFPAGSAALRGAVGFTCLHMAFQGGDSASTETLFPGLPAPTPPTPAHGHVPANAGDQNHAVSNVSLSRSHVAFHCASWPGPAFKFPATVPKLVFKESCTFDLIKPRENWMRTRGTSLRAFFFFSIKVLFFCLWFPLAAWSSGLADPGFVPRPCTHWYVLTHPGFQENLAQLCDHKTQDH